MEITTKGILTLSFYSSDLNRSLTIREYLIELVRTVWKEGEGFSGKRPFGNSGWEWDLAIPLINAGVLEGTLDSDGDLENFDRKQYDKIVLGCIDAL